MDAKQTRKLIDLAREKKIYLAEAMWTWFSPVAQQVKRWVDGGESGEIQKIVANYHTREAPTYLECNGKRYLITSGTSGYYPNPSRVCVFDDPHGEYLDRGLICEDDRSGTSFSAQFTSVIRPPGSDRYIPVPTAGCPTVRQVHGEADHLRHEAPFRELCA